ncbi:RNA polymerase sigma factor for flagellar operon [plant metagenome]
MYQLSLQLMQCSTLRIIFLTKYDSYCALRVETFFIEIIRYQHNCHFPRRTRNPLNKRKKTCVIALCFLLHERHNCRVTNPALPMYDAEDRLVALHAPMVRRLALQLLARLPASVELDDLIQSGMIGLLDAARRYRALPEAQFETYATARIRGAMLDELRSQDWLPRSVRAKARRIEQAIQKLEQALGRPPLEAEIAQALDLPLPEYRDLLNDAQGMQVVHYEDFGRDSEGDSDWHDRAAPADAEADPLARMLTGDLRNALMAAIDTLPDREKLLLSLYYEQDLNLKEIGAVMGVTEGRVCQLRTQATARIRAKLAERAWREMPQHLSATQVI